ncbi:ATP-binding cassette domain-containing protein [Streptosporangium lutulentum]
MAIVGPSGAGKSSLFRALLGELPITGGTLLFRGLDLVTDGEQIRHLLGYLPQQDHLHKSLTVRQNLRYAARLRLPADLPRKDREARILEIVDRLGLTERIDLRAARLSGGQLKRLSIALEILSDPLLLLLDEPTSGLDPGLDQEVMRLLKEIAGRGCSVIVVTHTPDNLILTDQVLVLGAAAYRSTSAHPSRSSRRWRSTTTRS